MDKIRNSQHLEAFSRTVKENMALAARGEEGVMVVSLTYMPFDNADEVRKWSRRVPINHNEPEEEPEFEVKIARSPAVDENEDDVYMVMLTKLGAGTIHWLKGTTVIVDDINESTMYETHKDAFEALCIALEKDVTQKFHSEVKSADGRKWRKSNE